MNLSLISVDAREVNPDRGVRNIKRKKRQRGRPGEYFVRGDRPERGSRGQKKQGEITGRVAARGRI